jgi:hypothetical protein
VPCHAVPGSPRTALWQQHQGTQLRQRAPSSIRLKRQPFARGSSPWSPASSRIVVSALMASQHSRQAVYSGDSEPRRTPIMLVCMTIFFSRSRSSSFRSLVRDTRRVSSCASPTARRSEVRHSPVLSRTDRSSVARSSWVCQRRSREPPSAAAARLPMPSKAVVETEMIVTASLIGWNYDWTRRCTRAARLLVSRSTIQRSSAADSA